jgi:hypothetical protein
MPLPTLTGPPVTLSPVPTYTMSGFDGATSTDPIDETSLIASNTGYQVSPALVVFQTPPAGRPM